MTQNKCLNEISEILKSNKSVVQTKTHAGEIKVEIKVATKEDEGTTFIIQLPFV